jgi:hypothetical protein
MAQKDYNYARAIIGNLRTYVAANADTQIQAIDSSLDNIADFTSPLPVLVKFPGVYVEWAGTKLKHEDDDGSVFEEHEFQIGVSVIDKNYNDIQDKLLKYVAGVSRVLEKLSSADLTGGTSTTLSGAAWEIVDLDSSKGMRISDAGIYRRDAYITFIVQIVESKG